MPALVEWLQGLALNIPCYNSEIIEFREKFEGKPLTDKQAQETIENYFKFMAMRLSGLWNHFNLAYC